MRSRYGLRASGNYVFPYVTASDSVGTRRASDSALLRVLELMDHLTLLDARHHIADTNTASFGCANCLGLETFKSCLEMQQAAAGAALPEGPQCLLHADFVRLAAAYAALPGVAFGQGGNALFYQTGLRDLGLPKNPISTPWYGVLRGIAAPGALPNPGRFKAVTKQSAHAHAVLSRKTLEIGFRYGTSEFLCASATTATLRSRADIRGQAATLAGGGGAEAGVAQARFALYERDFGRRYGGMTFAGLIEFEAARFTLDMLVSQLVGIIAQAPHAAQTPAIAASLCAQYRHALLELSLPARRNASDPTGFVAKLISDTPDKTLIGCASNEVNLPRASCDLKDIASALKTYSTSGPKLLETLGLQWKTEQTVEFGKQCGICEDEQGDGDLLGRAVSYYLANNAALGCNPEYGISYSDLSLEATGTDTFFDVSNAVVAQAIKVYTENLYNALSRSKQGDDQDFLFTLTYHLNNTPSFFIVYLQVLFLELSFSDATAGRRRVVKLVGQK